MALTSRSGVKPEPPWPPDPRIGIEKVGGSITVGDDDRLEASEDDVETTYDGCLYSGKSVQINNGVIPVQEDNNQQDFLGGYIHEILGSLGENCQFLACYEKKVIKTHATQF